MKVKLNKENITTPIEYGIKKVKPQIHKIVFSEKDVKNPHKAFDIFEKEVTKIASKKGDIELNSFSGAVSSIFNKFIKSKQIEKMNNNFVKFAENLVNMGKDNLAGIIYSFLIKANINNPELVEKFATNGLAIAKRFHDPVHIMARCENLRKIYSITEPKSEKLLKILYEEKRALSSIANNYQNVQKRYKTINSEMKPIENYKIMLGAIKIQIAKIIKTSKPKEAIAELQSAYELLLSVGKGKYTKEVEKLLSEIN